LTSSFAVYRKGLRDAFIFGGVRAPVGRYGGSLSHVRTDDLLGQTMAAA
jgi:acetyl-CoA acetyltransferase